MKIKISEVQIEFGGGGSSDLLAAALPAVLSFLGAKAWEREPPESDAPEPEAQTEPDAPNGAAAASA